MKYLTSIVKVSLALLILLSGCVFENHSQPYYLLTENTCEFPCWMGITPGETPYSEVDGHLEQMLQTFAKNGIEVTYAEKVHPGSFVYFQVFTAGSEIWVKLDSKKVVDEISIIFLNQPSVENFVANFRTPDYVGVCMRFRRAVPVMVYQGMRVYPKAKVPNYDDKEKTITIKNYYGERVDSVELEAVPFVNHYQYTFNWEEMANTVVFNTTNPDPAADCKDGYTP